MTVYSFLIPSGNINKSRSGNYTADLDLLVYLMMASLKGRNM